MRRETGRRTPTRYGDWALVTGASDGIGQAVAERLAADGVNLVLVARRADVLDASAAAWRARHGVTVRPIALDLSAPDGADRLLAATADLDIGLAVLAAGFGGSGAFIDSPIARELDMLDLNCRAVLVLTHGFAQRLVARGGGGLVLFGSVLGWQGVPYSAHYAATKAYVQSLAEGLRHELAPRGVDVLAVAPGPVHTGFAARATMRMDAADTPDRVAAAIHHALGRSGTVVPGRVGKALTWPLALLPRVARTRIVGRAMRRMIAE